MVARRGGDGSWRRTSHRRGARHFFLATQRCTFIFHPLPNIFTFLFYRCSTGRMCIKWARAAGLPLDAAFDVGCAVGGTAYELSTEFTSVHALDYSHAFIAAANKLKVRAGSSCCRAATCGFHQRQR